MSSWDDEVDPDERTRFQERVAKEQGIAQGRAASSEELLKAKPELPTTVVKKITGYLPPLTKTQQKLLAAQKEAAKSKGGKSRRATKKRSKRKARKTAKK